MGSQPARVVESEAATSEAVFATLALLLPALTENGSVIHQVGTDDRGRRTDGGAHLAVTLLALAALVVSCTASPASVDTPPAAAAPPELRAALERELDWLVNDRGIAPGAVGVVSRPDGRAAAAVGDARLQPRRPMAADDPVPLASITKSFTAVVVLQLVAEGRLSLDATIEELLPGRFPNGERVTVEHLLSHRSGVVDALDDDEVDDPVGSCEASSADDFLARAEVVPTSPPGANFRYSNVGYAALGLLIESVTGRTYADAVQERVSAPLGLDRTHVPDDVAADGPVRGYAMPPLVPEEGGPQDVTCTNLTGVAAAVGGLSAPLAEVATFYEALLGGRLVDADLLERMQVEPGRGYGLGLASSGTRCGPAHGHDGSLLGFRTQALASPDGTTVVVLAANGDSRSGHRVIGEAAERLFCDAGP